MNDISASTRQLLTLSQLAGVGPATLKKVMVLPDFLQLTIEQISSQVPAIERAIKDPSAWTLAQELAENQIREAQKFDAFIISVADENYPSLLASTKDDPLILFVKGSLAKNPQNSVAIIGTREPTLHGQLIAKRITQFFAEEEWSVVSGLAIGCDSIAHRAVLDAGGHTVAVLAHGLQMIAPAQNKNLAERILSAGGALVSEYPFGRAVQRQQYVKRDKIQAGLAQGVVMIQSDIVGGSLHASRASLDYQRWLAVPFPTDKDLSSNEPKVQANLLIASGTTAEKINLLKCSARDLNSVLILNSKDDYLLMKGGVSVINAYASQSILSVDRSVSPDLVEQAEPSHEYLHSTYDSKNKFSEIGVEKNLKENNRYSEFFSKLILQPITDKHADGSWSAMLEDNINLIKAMMARLKYLQKCLQKVQADLRILDDSFGESQQQDFCFSIDVFTDQMAHACEFLVAIHFILNDPSKYQSLRINQNLKSKKPTRSAVEDDTTYNAVLAVNCELSSGLKNFKEDSSNRLIATSDNIIVGRFSFFDGIESNDSSRNWIEEIIPRLEGLCDGFNHLVRLVLFDQSVVHQQVSLSTSGSWQ